MNRPRNVSWEALVRASKVLLAAEYARLRMTPCIDAAKEDVRTTGKALVAGSMLGFFTSTLSGFNATIVLISGLSMWWAVVRSLGQSAQSPALSNDDNSPGKTGSNP